MVTSSNQSISPPQGMWYQPKTKSTESTNSIWSWPKKFFTFFCKFYIMFAAINFYSPTVTSGHYICHLFTKNYAKLCNDKTVTRKATKTVFGDRSFQETCTFSFIYNKMLFRKNHLKAYFTHPWKTKIKFEICGFNQFQMVVK